MVQLTTQIIANRSIAIDYRDNQVHCEPHSHTFFELAYIIKGEAEHILDGKPTALKEGDYVIIEPGSIHYYKKKEKSDLLTIINCIFTSDFVYPNAKDNTFMGLLENPLLNIDTNQIVESPVNYVYHDINNHVLNLLSMMRYEYMNKKTNYTLIMKNHLNSIIISSVRNVSSTTSQSMNITAFIKDYVSLHYTEDDILNHMSKVSNYSTQYLSSRFKADTGETFKSFLQRIRVDAASNLLDNTKMTVSEIAEAVGYKDVKYFTEIFKKFKNTTPKQYKIYMAKKNISET